MTRFIQWLIDLHIKITFAKQNHPAARVIRYGLIAQLITYIMAGVALFMIITIFFIKWTLGAILIIMFVQAVLLVISLHMTSLIRKSFKELTDEDTSTAK